MNLSPQGRQALEQHFAQTARAFDVTANHASVGNHYSATPSVAQSIVNKIIEEADPFLQLINGMIPVSEIKGEKVGMLLTGRVASRTNTSANERTPKRLADTDANGYECRKTEFDVALSYAMIDMWAKFPDFAARYMQAVRKAEAVDLLTMGWRGTHVAAESNIATYPDLEDMAIGWLQQMRVWDGGNQYLQGAAGSITLGGADFPNLDVLAHETKLLLPKKHRNRNDLVFLVGGDVLNAQEGAFYENNGGTPTEKAMLSNRITKAYGNMPSIAAPFFPDGAVAVTPLKNLSIYYQDSSLRRTQKDKPEKDEVQEFKSLNIDYVIEDKEMMSFVEGIEFPA